jgi:hypothetical protein
LYVIDIIIFIGDKIKGALDKSYEPIMAGLFLRTGPGHPPTSRAKGFKPRVARFWEYPEDLTTGSPAGLRAS